MYLNNAYFPELNRNGDTNHNQLAIHERRTAVINNSNNIPTHSQTLRTPNGRRRESNTGYDNEAHNQCLINPTGQAKMYPNMSQNASTSRLAKENSNIHTNFYQAMAKLTTQHQELVMSFIGNLSIKSPNPHNVSQLPQYVQYSPLYQKESIPEEMTYSDESEY
ncbi:hypothetical protein JTB14_024517 [Gonioctena quinquepunctata]|nr:hypothetical protein JTB14_024517 [Gonioctena quinquepunctata]